MKRIRTILALSLTLAACATLPPETSAAVKYESLTFAAVQVETLAQSRCPRTPVEIVLFVTARNTFDLGPGIDLPPPYRQRVTDAREQTNRVCSL